MRKPSRGTAVLYIVSPIIGSLLLWYVVLPWADDKELSLLYAESTSYVEQQDDPPLAVSGEPASGIFSTPATVDNGGGAGYVHDNSEYTPPVNNETAAEAYQFSERQSDDGGQPYAYAPRAESYRSVQSAKSAVADQYQGSSASTQDHTIAMMHAAAEQIKRVDRTVKEVKDLGRANTKGGSAPGGLFSLPPDGDDPVDVPIDGGLGILITATLGYGARRYRKMQKGKGRGGERSK